MTRKMLFGRRIAGALVAVVLCAAVPAEAAPRSGQWVRLVSWLGAWSGLGPFLTSAFGWSDAGPLIDPDGGDGSWSTAGQGDEGVAIDPLGRNGSRSTSGQGDEGVAIDPDGRNGSRSVADQGDEGPIIDPNGGKG